MFRHEELRFYKVKPEWVTKHDYNKQNILYNAYIYNYYIYYIYKIIRISYYKNRDIDWNTYSFN